MKIGIESDVKLYLVNQFVGKIRIDGLTLTDKENDEDGRDVGIEFVNANGINKYIDITAPILDAEEHLNEQLSKAIQLAVEDGKTIDRYTIKSMKVSAVLIKEKTVELEFLWTDCFGENRLYFGREYELIECDETAFYANPVKPTFYYY